MCGIAGIVTTDARRSSASLLSCVKAMTDSLAHRGPDGEGTTQAMPSGSNGYTVLGHRRLSIVDLAGGVQPMSCAHSMLWLTFNGEIYNFPELRVQLSELGYAFETHSDTEVVIAAYRHYGADCVKLFNGMFSFALWDAEAQKLFIARDSFGKKPFYYRLNDDGFQFASEIKAFTVEQGVASLKVNKATLRECALLRYAPGELTLVDSILKLEPGTSASYDPGTHTLTKNRYYQHPDAQPRINNTDTRVPTTPVHKQFLALLDDSVASRLNCDVPFGAFLSGGIDSTVIVALMTKHMTSPVKTFSIGFEQKNLSELDSASLVARTFGTDHHEKVIKPEDFITYLPEAIYYRDGPVSEPSDVPILLLSRMASEKVKMVLTGEGSDEVLGGYPKHAFEKYAAYSALIPRPFRRVMRSLVRQHLPVQHEKIKCALSSLLADNASDRMQRWFGSTDIEIRDQLSGNLPESVTGSQQKQDAAANTSVHDSGRFAFEGGSKLRNILAFDQSVWLPNNLLERGDRMTMAASLEARMPFLDVRLAQFVSAMPDRFRVRGKTTKWVLREAAKDIIPDEIIQRKKLGFKVPIEEWFRTSLSDYLYAHIAAPGACLHEYLNPTVINKLYSEHLANRQNHEKILWSLLNMEIWLQQLNGVDVSQSPKITFAPDSVASHS